MVIDQEGRLFKKVNIIDFLAILAVILIIGGMFFKAGAGYVKKNIMHMKVKSDTKIEYFTFKVSDVDSEVANKVRLRERLCDDDAIEAWIVKVKKTPAVYDIPDLKSGDIYQQTNPDRRDLVITFKAKVSNDDSIPYIKVGDQTANIGSNFELKTKNVDFNGKIIGITDRW